MADHEIGGTVFTLLQGEVPRIRPEIEVITKPGEDGHRRRNLGLRSPQFKLTSISTHASKDTARATFVVYTDKITGGAQELIKDGYNYTTDADDDYEVVVVDVRLLDLSKKACIAGTSNTWQMTCEWTLLLVPDTP
jgi:hypothetical protein